MPAQTYPEGDYPDGAYSSSGYVWSKAGGGRATRSCICGAEFKGSVEDGDAFAEAHKNHEPDYCECCGRGW
jgi:hypothetical protein